MLDFFYKSIDTLKEVKKPTRDDVFKMTVAVLVVVFVSWVLFSIIDFFFLKLYNGAIYTSLNSIFK